MFVIILTYTSALHDIDQYLEEHNKFLEDGYARREFIFSGRQVPRTGGMIVTRAESRDAVEAMIQDDPFHRHGLADYWIIEVKPTMYDPDFAPFIE